MPLDINNPFEHGPMSNVRVGSMAPQNSIDSPTHRPSNERSITINWVRIIMNRCWFRTYKCSVAPNNSTAGRVNEIDIKCKQYDYTER